MLQKISSSHFKTLFLCWVCPKRAFAVSGRFSKALSDLITDLHNSNKPLVQITLFGEMILEEKFVLLGFIKAMDIQIEKMSGLWGLIQSKMTY